MEADPRIRTFSSGRLSITWGADKRYWTSVEKEGSMSGEAAYLREVCWLELSGDVEIQLPPGTYMLSWVLQFEEGTVWGYPVSLSATDGKVTRSESLYLPPTRETASRVAHDGWLEYDALQFRVDGDKPMQTVNLKFSLKEVDGGRWKSGMFFDGVIIRPISMFSKPALL